MTLLIMLLITLLIIITITSTLLLSNRETFCSSSEWNTYERNTQETTESNYRILISAQCKPYQDWQAASAYHSIKKVWPESNITRILACDNPESYKYTEIMPSFITKDYTFYDKEEYLPFNRPGSLIEYFAYNDPEEEYLIIMDPDMILLKKIDLKPTIGNAIGQFYDHMNYGQAPGKPNTGQGLKKIAKKLLPSKIASKASFSGEPEKLSRASKGSEFKAQPVGAPIIICKQDLQKIAPLWLYYTHLIRTDPECKHIAGWIAEMHGYALASAHLGIYHTLMNDLADRTPYNVKDPYILHYDLEHTSAASAVTKGGNASGENFKWDKRDYMYDLLNSSNTRPMPVPKTGNENFKKIFEELNNGIEKTISSKEETYAIRLAE